MIFILVIIVMFIYLIMFQYSFTNVCCVPLKIIYLCSYFTACHVCSDCYDDNVRVVCSVKKSIKLILVHIVYLCHILYIHLQQHCFLSISRYCFM